MPGSWTNVFVIIVQDIALAVWLLVRQRLLLAVAPGTYFSRKNAVNTIPLIFFAFIKNSPFPCYPFYTFYKYISMNYI